MTRNKKIKPDEVHDNYNEHYMNYKVTLKDKLNFYQNKIDELEKQLEFLYSNELYEDWDKLRKTEYYRISVKINVLKNILLNKTGMETFPLIKKTNTIYDNH